MPMPSDRVLPAVTLSLLLSACGAGDGAGGAATARAPARAGEVWELDLAGGRAAAPAALLAYVHGLHVMVLDGNTAYAGMTRLEAERTGEARTFPLPNGGTVDLMQTGDSATLRFSSGETVALRKQQPRESR